MKVHNIYIIISEHKKFIKEIYFYLIIYNNVL